MLRTTMNRIVICLLLLAAPHAVRAEREAGGREGNLLAVDVVVTSPGDGIDVETRLAVLDVLAQALKAGDVRKLINTHWGREGEVTTCVEFYSRDALSRWLSTLKTILDDADRGPNGRARTSTQVRSSCVER